MQVGAQALSIIKFFEKGPKGSFASSTYFDPVGLPTIGWGHVVLRGENFLVPLDAEAADELLRRDLEKKGKQLLALLRNPPQQHHFDAMLCLVFNTGVGVADGIKGDFADSTLLAHYNAGKYQMAGAEFSKWVYSGPAGAKKILSGLVKRRAVEANLFLTGKVALPV